MAACEAFRPSVIVSVLLHAKLNLTCQHSLWEETGVWGKPTTSGRASADPYHVSIISWQRRSIKPTITEANVSDDVINGNAPNYQYANMLQAKL